MRCCWLRGSLNLGLTENLLENCLLFFAAGCRYDVSMRGSVLLDLLIDAGMHSCVADPVDLGLVKVMWKMI